MSLTLLPNLLSPTSDHTLFLPRSVEACVATLDGLFAESERGGRQFLKLFKRHIPIVLIKDHDLEEVVKKKEHWGLISDAGMPVLADPGAALVQKAYQLGISVNALPGPSSVLLGLALSGLPGQRFAFHGYLPKERKEREQTLKILEKEETTHIFIEAPHRNLHALQSCLSALSPQTLLCLAWDLCGASQGVHTAPVNAWDPSRLPNLDLYPTIFLFIKKVF